MRYTADLASSARAPLAVDHILRSCGVDLHHADRLVRHKVHTRMHARTHARAHACVHAHMTPHALTRASRKAVLLNHEGRALRAVSRFDLPRFASADGGGGGHDYSDTLAVLRADSDGEEGGSDDEAGAGAEDEVRGEVAEEGIDADELVGVEVGSLNTNASMKPKTNPDPTNLTAMGRSLNAKPNGAGAGGEGAAGGLQGDGESVDDGSGAGGGGGRGARASAAPPSAAQSEAALAQCEALLRAGSDERRLAGALLAAKLLAGADAPTHALRRLYAAMAPSLLGRLLNSNAGVANGAAYRQLGASICSTFARGAPELAGALASRHAPALVRVVEDAASSLVSAPDGCPEHTAGEAGGKDDAGDAAASRAAALAAGSDAFECARACADGVVVGAVGAAAGLDALFAAGFPRTLAALARALARSEGGQVRGGGDSKDAFLEKACLLAELLATAAAAGADVDAEADALCALGALAAASAGVTRFVALAALARRARSRPRALAAAAAAGGLDSLRGALAGVIAAKIKPEHRAAALEVLAAVLCEGGMSPEVSSAYLCEPANDSPAGLQLPAGALLALCARVARIEVEVLQNDAMRLAAHEHDVVRRARVHTANGGGDDAPAANSAPTPEPRPVPSENARREREAQARADRALAGDAAQATARDALAVLPACYSLLGACVAALAEAGAGGDGGNGGMGAGLPAKTEADAFAAVLEATDVAAEFVLELEEVGALADEGSIADKWRSLAEAAADLVCRLGAEAPGCFEGARRRAALAAARRGTPRAAAAAAPALLSRCVVIAARVRVPRDTHAQARARARARALRCAHTRSHTNGACARARMLAHTICWG